MDREKILELIRCLDDLLHEENERAQSSGGHAAASADPSGGLATRAAVQALLNEKEELVGKILAQDLEILSRVESEKSSIIRELRAIRKGREAIRGYHSGSAANLLDEKA